MRKRANLRNGVEGKAERSPTRVFFCGRRNQEEPNYRLDCFIRNKKNSKYSPHERCLGLGVLLVCVLLIAAVAAKKSKKKLAMCNQLTFAQIRPPLPHLVNIFRHG